MRFTVRAPASAANLGPGFDALGLALDLWNEILVDTAGEAGAVILEGPEAALLTDRENLALTAMRRLADEHGRVLPPFALTVRTVVPVARGLGSSAAALVAGLVAADRLLDLRLAVADLYALAWRMEGHGDNVGAALYGGAVLAVPTVHEAVRLCACDDLGLLAVVFVPAITGATWAARAALPATVPHPDAAYNVAVAAGLVLGLRTGDRALIAAGMHDRLHEPYRARLFPHLEPLAAAARHAGALGACLSGAGPSILALSPPETAPGVAAAYTATAHHLGLVGEVITLRPAARGAHVVEASDLDGEVSGDGLTPAETSLVVPSQTNHRKT
jgi:homoserine kinase